ncbi:MAG: hypothetical protein ACKOOL_09620 [Novosphingobium sp.]
MEAFFLYGGMALCLLCLWLLARKDWIRLTTISRTVDGEVIGHRISHDSDGTSYAAIFRFSAEGATHEVNDAVLSGQPRPPIGTRVTLRYPFGRPDLARVPRLWTWFFVYTALLLMLAILAGRAGGWLQPGSGSMPG